MGTLVIATSNLGKLDEFKEMFKELPVELKCLADYPPLPPPNENGRTFAANAKIKAAYYAKNLKEFCLADDSGLEVALAVANPTGRIVAETDGSCEGMLLHEPLGENGFGYDPLFWSTELHKGMGEATPEEKNKISHRGKAVSKLIAMWKKTANNKNGGKRPDRQGRKAQQEQQANGKAEQQNGKPKPETKQQPEPKSEAKVPVEPMPEAKANQ